MRVFVSGAPRVDREATSSVLLTCESGDPLGDILRCSVHDGAGTRRRDAEGLRRCLRCGFDVGGVGPDEDPRPLPLNRRFDAAFFDRALDVTA